MIIPLNKKLKKKTHRDIALVQDLLAIEIYNNFPEAIIHGGTAIWRCYGSNRFSEDIDIYLLPKLKDSNKIEIFLKSLKSNGFTVKKFKKTKNSIYSKFSFSNIIVSFEVLFKNIKNYITKTFEMSDGTFIIVNTLTPEDMIIEKILAYKKRRKIRDLYDIFFLLKFVEDKEKIEKPLKNLIQKFEDPVDAKDLKTIIISGAVPNISDMLREMKRWVK